MSISILNRGTSGGLKPQLTINAPEGSVLSITKNGVTVASYTLGSNEQSHTFEVSKGEYEVRYTNNGSSETRVVVVDAACILHMTFPSVANYTLLYYFGDECTSVTGGWSGKSGSSNGYPYYAMAKKSDHFYAEHEGSNAWSYNMAAKNNIDFSQYSVMSAGFYLHSIPRSYSEIAWLDISGSWISAVDNNDRSEGEESYQGFGTRPVPSTNGVVQLNFQTGLANHIIYGKVQAYVVVLGKSDDVSALYSLAGVSASSIEELLVDEGKLRTIFNNGSAVSHMANSCTGEFMLKALDSVLIKGNKFLTALNESPYKNIVLENTHWAKFLKVFDM